MSAVTKGGKSLFQLLRTLPNEGVGSRIVSLGWGVDLIWFDLFATCTHTLTRS